MKNISPKDADPTFAKEDALEEEEVDKLSPEELDKITYLTGRLLKVQKHNRIRQSYYEGKNSVEQLNISNRPDLRAFKASVAFPAIVVDTINSRINLEGFMGNEYVQPLVREIFNENYLKSDSIAGNRDSLIAGCNYISLGYGDTSVGEPRIIWLYEDPNTCYGEWNKRSRRLDSFLKVTFNAEGNLELGMLELPGEQIIFKYGSTPLPLAVSPQPVVAELLSRTETGVPFVRAVKNSNTKQSSEHYGDSEISHPVMFTTQAILRKYQGAEVASELYAFPSRVILNAMPDIFKNADGLTRASHANSMLGNTLVIPPGKGVTGNQNGLSSTTHTASIQQLDSADPNFIISMIDDQRKNLAAETGIPVAAFGLTSSSAPSAESLKTQEIGLVKKCHDKITNYRQSVEMAMKLALLMLEKVDKNVQFESGDLSSIQAMYGDPAAPTKAADIDGVVKLIQAGVLEPNSEVTYDLLNLTEPQKTILREDAEKNPPVNLTSALTQLAENANQDPTIRELSTRSE